MKIKFIYTIICFFILKGIDAQSFKTLREPHTCSTLNNENTIFNTNKWSLSVDGGASSTILSKNTKGILLKEYSREGMQAEAKTLYTSGIDLSRLLGPRFDPDFDLLPPTINEFTSPIYLKNAFYIELGFSEDASRSEVYLELDLKSSGINFSIAELEVYVAAIFPLDRDVKFSTFLDPDTKNQNLPFYEITENTISNEGRNFDYDAFVPVDNQQGVLYYPWRRLSDLAVRSVDGSIQAYRFKLTQDFIDNVSDPSNIPRIYFSVHCTGCSNVDQSCIDDNRTYKYCKGRITEIIDIDPIYFTKGFDITTRGAIDVLGFEIITETVGTEEVKKIKLEMDYQRTSTEDAGIVKIGNVILNISSDPSCNPIDICDELSGKCGALELVEDEQYRVSFWAKFGSVNKLSLGQASLDISFYSGGSSQNGLVESFAIDPKLGDQWQLVTGEFIVPKGTCASQLKFINNGLIPVYFDDVRITPKSSYAESYVYNPSTRELTAKLDANNYATIYEYDTEGNLKRIKKETVNGVVTIQEGRKQISRKLK